MTATKCRCNANDAMMNATHKINNRADTQNMERIWSVGLGALQDLGFFMGVATRLPFFLKFPFFPYIKTPNINMDKP